MQAVDYLIMAAFAAGAYFIGGLSPSVFLSRRVGGFDVREVGSGNAGSTNIVRSMGWGYGVLNLALDAIKGAAPVLLALLVLPEGLPRELAMAAAGLGVVVGHNFSVYMKFKGGKGVAASLGAALVICPVATLLALVAAVVVIAVTRYVSLGSLLGTLGAVILCIVLPETPASTLLFAVPALALMCYTHRENIRRLLRGEENRLTAGKLNKKG